MICQGCYLEKEKLYEIIVAGDSELFCATCYKYEIGEEPR